jgi:2-dehydro-3-deoxygluconokinase
MKVVCFGEIMLRLNPQGYIRLVQADQLELSFAGAEANVAVSISNLGGNAAFVTKLPDNNLTKAALRNLKAHNVDVSHVVLGGDRMGSYYVEKGASQRASTVIYDRKYSSISMADKKDFNWDEIFAGSTWFHFTGISPALGDNVADICLEACQKAKKMGLTVSCDLNYRKKLWSSEKAGEVMGKLMEYVDIAIANEEDCEKVFGIKSQGAKVTEGVVPMESYEQVAKELSERFDIPMVAITLRGSKSASDNDWAGLLYANGEYYHSPSYSIHIVDRVGGGDSFGGALIYALSSNFEPQKAINFAVAASCLKHTIEHDFNEVTLQEVLNLMNGDASGRVQR